MYAFIFQLPLVPWLAFPFFPRGLRVALPEWHFNSTFQIQCNKEIKAHWEDGADFFFFFTKCIVLIMSFLPTPWTLPASSPTPDPKSANFWRSDLFLHTFSPTRFKVGSTSRRCILGSHLHAGWVPVARRDKQTSCCSIMILFSVLPPGSTAIPTTAWKMDLF